MPWPDLTPFGEPSIGPTDGSGCPACTQTSYPSPTATDGLIALEPAGSGTDYSSPGLGVRSRASSNLALARRFCDSGGHLFGEGDTDGSAGIVPTTFRMTTTNDRRVDIVLRARKAVGEPISKNDLLNKSIERFLASELQRLAKLAKEHGSGS